MQLLFLQQGIKMLILKYRMLGYIRTSSTLFCPFFQCLSSIAAFFIGMLYFEWTRNKNQKVTNPFQLRSNINKPHIEKELISIERTDSKYCVFFLFSKNLRSNFKSLSLSLSQLTKKNLLKFICLITIEQNAPKKKQQQQLVAFRIIS